MAVALLRRRSPLSGLSLPFNSRHLLDLPLASLHVNVFYGSRSKSRSGGILLAEPFGDRSIFVEGAWDLNNRMRRLYKKPTQLLATLFAVAVLSQSLEVVVEHSRMTDQTHLLGVLDRARSDQSAAPGADNVVRRLDAFELVVGLQISAHVFRSKQISFQLMNSPQYQ